MTDREQARTELAEKTAIGNSAISVVLAHPALVLRALGMKQGSPRVWVEPPPDSGAKTELGRVEAERETYRNAQISTERGLHATRTALDEALGLLTYWASKNRGQEGVEFNQATEGRFWEFLQEQDALNADSGAEKYNPDAPRGFAHDFGCTHNPCTCADSGAET